jgi:hypothetical protein
MAFKITYEDGSTEEYGDDDRYRVQDAGVLQIDTMNRGRRILAPAAWRMVEDSQGQPGPF